MPEDAVIDKLNEHMGIDGAVHFQRGAGGFIAAVLRHQGAEACVYQHGAHVSHYQPSGQAPVLFMSRASRFEDGKAIRGGVPICFPWFAAKADDPAAPAHGLARQRAWKFRSVQLDDEGNPTVVLALKWSPKTIELWPHKFVATQTVTLTDSLTMTLWVKHLGLPDSEPFTFEAALHTYLAVGDVRQVKVHGLSNTEYIDKVDQFRRKRQGDEPITVSGETDRIYLATAAGCVADDPVLRRRITIAKEGSHNTVVWNPWAAKAKAMADFGDDEWPSMLCIETCNVADHAVTLSSGQSHAMTAKVMVQP